MSQERINMIVCSTSALSEEDAEIITWEARRLMHYPGSRWILDTFFGFIVMPGLPENIKETMDKLDLSDEAYRLFTEGLESFGADAFRFDRDAPALEGWPVYEW